MRPRRVALGALMVLALMLLVALTLRWLPHRPLSAFAPSSTAVYDQHGALLRLTLASDHQYRLWTPLERVKPEFVQALLLHEDRYFFCHPGVNPSALVRAAWATSAGQPRQGGSTLTMQLARLIYHLNTRSVGGKLRQIAAALWLELRYSKHDILEAHVNLVPYGGNVQGVGAASLIYFGQRADQLTVDEALALALIPQSPRARDPRRDGSALSEAQQRLTALWRERRGAAGMASALPLQFNSTAQLPFEAPHAVNLLLERSGGEHSIASTLDLNLQHLLEQRLQQYVAQQRRLGIHNASAMLVDVRDMQVKALVGSADFFGASIDGQVNGALARRSPGSTLKPFIYALAMDQGLIHPASMLKDAPTSFGPYAPENFDGAFVGPISARLALVRSRNVPAVALASQLAQPSLYEFLRSAGVSHMASERHYGLALALGGGEMSMEELVELYAMLANRGVLRPLRYTQDQPVSPGTRLLSDEACFMVLDMLRDNPRPDGTDSGAPPVAWKSGTSWGFRDAWSIGVVGPYVIAVWVGNFDGSSNPALVGTQMAAPLLFQMVDGLRVSVASLPDLGARVPAGVRRVEICAASGDLPNADCPQTQATWFIPGRSPIRISTVHRRIEIDTRSGARACADTPAEFRQTQLFEYWPSDIEHLFAQAGLPRRRPPAGHCAAPVESGAALPTITSPLSATSYALHSHALGSEAVPLSAIASADAHSLYWFVDGAFVAETAPAVAGSWRPTHGGSYRITLTDDLGASTTREVSVAVIP